MATTKKSYGFRLSRQAENHLENIVEITGMTKTAAVELAVAKLSKSLTGETKMNDTLRDTLIKTLQYADKGIAAVVIKYSDGHYESAPKSAFAEYTRDDPDAAIVYEVRNLGEWGSEATTEDIPAIVDMYILPAWDEIEAR